MGKQSELENYISDAIVKSCEFLKYNNIPLEEILKLPQEIAKNIRELAIKKIEKVEMTKADRYYIHPFPKLFTKDTVDCVSKADIIKALREM